MLQQTGFQRINIRIAFINIYLSKNWYMGNVYTLSGSSSVLAICLSAHPEANNIIATVALQRLSKMF